MSRQQLAVAYSIVTGVKSEYHVNPTHFEILLDITLQTSLLGNISHLECKRLTKLIFSKENEANRFLRHILLFNPIAPQVDRSRPTRFSLSLGCKIYS